MVPNVEQEWLYSNGLPLQQRTNKNDYKNRLHCILWCYCFIALTNLPLDCIVNNLGYEVWLCTEQSILESVLEA